MDLYLHVGMFMAKRGQHVHLRWGKRLMEFYLQFGYGMMEHCRHLLSEWSGGTVILSPRDLTDEQLIRLASEVTSLPNATICLDPQFYLPHADHERLCSHDYWPEEYATNSFWQGPALTELLSKLNTLNHSLQSSAFILPGLLANPIDDDWLEIHRAVLEEARTHVQELPLIATIALAADAARNQDQIALLLERTTTWNPAGYYIVCEHPGGKYLVDDPNWLVNVLDLAAGLRLRGSKVILGYCNQQMLIAAVAKVHAICSDTWMNVRSFASEKFRSTYEEEIKQRAKWYYCPDALSEYKVPFLDIAHRQNILGMMTPLEEADRRYAASLFSGAQPSSVGFSEQAAFRHYLHCLRKQTISAEKISYDETVAAHESFLDSAESLLATLGAAGIRGQQRDFHDIIDVNRAALSLFNNIRGPMLRRRWSSL